MKKNMVVFATFIILGMSIFFACKKESKTIQSSSKAENIISAQSSNTCLPDIIKTPFVYDDKSLDEYINTVAALHNEYMDYYYASYKSKSPSFPNKEYDEHFSQTAKEFFDSKDLIVNSDYYDCIKASKPETNFLQYSSFFSDKGQDLLKRLNDLINNYDPEKKESFNGQMEKLYDECNLIEKKEEMANLKFAIRIGINSISYWTTNAKNWVEMYEETNDIKYLMSNRRILSNAGKADVSGALRGAIGGGLGAGPAGAIAGGLVVAGVSSAASIIWDAIF